MTKEERIKTLKEWMPELELMAKYNNNPIDYQRYSAIDMTIKSSEQESVLDKIRAEITDWQTDIHDNEYDAETHDFVFERIYEIIDKYKAGK